MTRLEYCLEHVFERWCIGSQYTTETFHEWRERRKAEGLEQREKVRQQKLALEIHRMANTIPVPSILAKASQVQQNLDAIRYQNSPLLGNLSNYPGKLLNWSDGF